MALLCYNRGCGQRFDPEANADDACTYHPGVPVFHDALKKSEKIIRSPGTGVTELTAMWVSGSEPRSSARTASALSC